MHSNATQLTKEIRNLIDSQEAQVRLAAIEAMGRCGNAVTSGLYSAQRSNSLPPMPPRAQACRIAVRNLLRDPSKLDLIIGSWKFAVNNAAPTRMSLALDDALAVEMATILPGLDSELAPKVFCAMSTRIPMQMQS